MDATSPGASRQPLLTVPRKIHNLILSLLSPADIARLSCTCCFWHELATPIAYACDARQASSRALRWAAASPCQDASDQHVHMAVIRLSIQHGGNVNLVFLFHEFGHCDWGTALHLTAARGKDKVVRELLQAGADAGSRCSGFDFFQSHGMLDPAVLRALGPGVCDALQRTRWLPALVPVLLGHTRTVRRLVNAGASPLLAVTDRTEPATGPGVSFFHVFAAMSEAQLAQHAELFRAVLPDLRQSASLDVRMSGKGWAPLHLALSSGNSVMLRRLLRLGARVDVESELGRTPLNYAVWLCGAAGQPPPRRRKLVAAVETLLDHGADANHRTHAAVDETPLICTVLCGQDEGRGVSCEMRHVAEMLVSRGADVNLRSHRGLTVLHRLCLGILQRGSQDSLNKFLAYLISVGADVNLPLPTTGRTLLHEYLRSPLSGTNSTQRLLVNSGATIGPREADAVLRLWIQSSRLRSRTLGYNALQHKQHLSQDAINEAYHHALSTQDQKLYMSLMQENLRPTNASQLVALMANTVKHKLWPLKEHLAFDPGWADDTGRTYLHMIVMKLVGEHGYRESAAVSDAEFFIDRGASVLARDDGGFTALQRLQRLRANRSFRDLRLVLFEASARETGGF